MPSRGSKVVPVRVPESELRALDQLADALRLTRSGVIRLALDKLRASVYDTVPAGPSSPNETTGGSSVSPSSTFPAGRTS